MKKLAVLILTVNMLWGLAPALGADPESFSLPFDSFQESSLILNVGNFNNRVEESNTSNSSIVIDSYKNNTGLFNLNQASGSINNQSNMAVITFTPGISLSDFQLEYRAVSMVSMGNTLKYSGKIQRQSIIENSFDNSKGVFLVNQSSGNLNQQSNLFILSLGSGIILGAPLNMSELAIIVGSNKIEYAENSNVERRDILKDSFSGSKCVGIISQSSGDLNTIRNTLGISFSREVR